MLNWKYYGLIAIILLLWATSYVCIRYSIGEFSSENLAFLRYLSASFGFILVSFVVKIKRPALRDIPALAMLGFIGFSLYNLFLNFGQRTVTASTASFIINTVPFLTMLIVLYKKEEKIMLKDWIGMGIAFSGVSIIIFNKDGDITALDFNALYILAAACCQAVYFTMQKKLLTNYSPVELTSFAVWFGTLLLFFFSNRPIQSVADADLIQILVVAYLGIFPGMIAYLLIAFLFREYKVTNISSYILLVPFITLLMGWVFLK